MINEAMLLGNVGKKDTKSIKNGSQLTSIALATTSNFIDAQGAKQKRTTWHNIHCFNKLSDIAEKYVKVGDLVFVRGEIMHRKIETGERAGQYAYSVVAHELKFIPQQKKEKEEPKKEVNGNQRSDQFDDDDIPF